MDNFVKQKNTPEIMFAYKLTVYWKQLRRLTKYIRLLRS